METPSIPVWQLKRALQEEIIQAHLYGTPQEAYRLRMFARLWDIEIDNEYIDKTIGTTVRNMEQDEFIRWLDQRRQRDEKINPR